MTFEEFVKKYNGKKVDWDKKFGYQCVDLFRQYCDDVLDIEHTGGVVGAKDLFEKYDELPKEKYYFNKINRIERPEPGDAAVWGSSPTNQYGHVALVITEFAGDLVVLEQDGFKQDGAKINIRSKDNLLGYLRKKDAIHIY